MKHTQVLTFLVFIALVQLLSGCNESDDDGGGGVSITIGDTVIVIPESAIAFAGSRTHPNHFQYHAYILREYQVATNSEYTPDPYTGTLEEWKSETWDERQNYLQPPYGHDINTVENNLYYYSIGMYFSQFGYGWDDTFDSSTVDFTNTNPNYNPWHDEANGYVDDPSTIGFDGSSPFFFEYRSMWLRYPPR